MAASQPFGFICQGGLDTNTNQLAALGNAGVAIELENFEVDSDSGYRRINGYTPYGTAKPNGTNDIKGIMAYAGGVLVCSGANIMFTIDGTTWVNVARDGQTNQTYNHTDFFNLSLEDRTGQGQTSFIYEEGAGAQGTVIILDGDNLPYILKIEGTGALTSRTFHGHTFVVDSSVTPSVGTIHETHLLTAAGTNLVRAATCENIPGTPPNASRLKNYPTAPSCCLFGWVPAGCPHHRRCRQNLSFPQRRTPLHH